MEPWQTASPKVPIRVMMNVKMMLMRMIINDKDIYEEDNDFYLIDSILEGADSSGHVVRDDPVKGAGEEGDHDEKNQDQDESDDGNVGDNHFDDNGQW